MWQFLHILYVRGKYITIQEQRITFIIKIITKQYNVNTLAHELIDKIKTTQKITHYKIYERSCIICLLWLHYVA